jgi:hypothetical protein
MPEKHREAKLTFNITFIKLAASSGLALKLVLGPTIQKLSLILHFSADMCR